MTRATAVHKSLITREAAFGSRSARRDARGASSRTSRRPRRRGSGLRALGCRAVQILEKAKEAAVGGQNEGRAPAAQRITIGLHRAVEGEEFLVLAKSVGIGLDALRIAVAAHPLAIPLRLGEDHGAFALGIGADSLGRLGALAAVLRRLLLAFRLHAGEDRLAVFLGQVGAPDPHVDDIDAEGLPLSAYFIADLVHDRRALVRQQR